jgi:hypothetical protein
LVHPVGFSFAVRQKGASAPGFPEEQPRVALHDDAEQRHEGEPMGCHIVHSFGSGGPRTAARRGGARENAPSIAAARSARSVGR